MSWPAAIVIVSGMLFVSLIVLSAIAVINKNPKKEKPQ